MAEAFRRFRVVRKVPESSVITSFHLAPADGGPLWEARPGQYLTVRVPAEGGTVLRTYSLSCAVDAPDCHRITVKRESLGSVWLHDRVAEGDEIEVAAPRGAFHLDEDSTRPVLLLAGGVGVTPLLSMLHRLAATDRRAFFVHASENGDVHAMRDEVAALAAASEGRITVRCVYRAPTDADRAAGRFDAEGVVDRALLQSLLPLDDYQVYLCGPTPFMVAMWRLLTGLGIAPERIAYEFFGKGGSLAALAAEPEALRVRPATHVPAHAPKSLARLEFLTDPDARAVPEAPPRLSSAPQAAVPAAPGRHLARRVVAGVAVDIRVPEVLAGGHVSLERPREVLPVGGVIQAQEGVHGGVAIHQRRPFERDLLPAVAQATCSLATDDGAVDALLHGQANLRLALDLDYFRAGGQFHARGFQVQVLHVRVDVGHTPGHPLVAPDHDGGQAGNTGANRL